jgi:hypothetical protein
MLLESFGLYSFCSNKLKCIACNYSKAVGVYTLLRDYYGVVAMVHVACRIVAVVEAFEVPVARMCRPSRPDIINNLTEVPIMRKIR